MPTASCPRLRHYGVVVLTVALATGLRWPLWPILGSELAFLLFWPTVVFCAWYGGLRTGLLATVLCSLAAVYFLLEPLHSLAVTHPANLLGLGVFAGMGCLLSLLMEALHRARARVDSLARRTAAEREHLRVTLTSIGDAVIATDTEGRVTFLNPVAEQLTGWQQGEAAGRTLKEVFHIVNAVTRALVENPVEKVLRSGSVAGMANHTIFIARDGTERPIDDSAAPIRDRQGQVIGVILVFRDVSERDQAEEAFREGDRRKNEFLGVLAHEERNHLAAVRNAAQVLRRLDLADPTARWAADVVDRQVSQLARLVDDLLDVTRVAQGKLRLQEEEVDLAEVIGQAAETCRPLLNEKEHSLTVSLPPVPLRLRGDRARLGQVLTNLVGNSAKYTPNGGSIRLAAEREGEEAVVRVRDNGVGIPAELLPRVFDLFAQGERVNDGGQGGLGIGLSLVKSLVEAHGGRVEARSDGPGQGSEFVVRLPAMDETPGQATSRPEDHDSDGTTPFHRVLVVDDNRDSADSLAMLLQIWGHETAVAYDGPSAVAAAEEFRPGVILLDILLPGELSGYDVAERLLSEPGCQTPVLVAVTGLGREEDQRLFRERGFRHHLVKPVDPHVLQHLLVGLPRAPWPPPGITAPPPAAS